MSTDPTQQRSITLHEVEYDGSFNYVDDDYIGQVGYYRLFGYFIDRRFEVFDAELHTNGGHVTNQSITESFEAFFDKVIIWNCDIKVY